MLPEVQGLAKLIKRTTRNKTRALFEEFSIPLQEEKPSLMAKRANTCKRVKLEAMAVGTRDCFTM